MALGMQPWRTVQSACPHHRCYPTHWGHGDSIPVRKNSICKLERNTAGRRIRQNSAARERERKQGGGQTSGLGQLVWGLENRGKSFRLHPKTNVQLSRDFFFFLM